MLNINENKENCNGFKKCSNSIFFNASKWSNLNFRYKAGMLQTESGGQNDDDENEKEMSRLINETTSSILRIYSEFGPQAVEDWEVNELLEWTHGLNYDDYLLDWKTVGTSASSNVITGKIMFCFLLSRTNSSDLYLRFDLWKLLFIL